MPEKGVYFKKLPFRCSSCLSCERDGWEQREEHWDRQSVLHAPTLRSGVQSVQCERRRNPTERHIERE